MPFLPLNQQRQSAEGKKLMTIIVQLLMLENYVENLKRALATSIEPVCPIVC